jgi:hypothetical protein
MLAGTDFEEEPVSVDLRGLLPDTTYHFRLTATDRENPACAEEECTVHGPDTTFTTRPAVGIEAQWASEVSARGAVLRARLDPLGAPARWWIEYGASAAYGRSTAKETLAGGFGAITVSSLRDGLEPGRTYHYRFVASDEREVEEGGETLTRPFIVHGPDRTFTTQTSGLGFALPDGRAWEMVSPPNKYGARILGSPVGAIQAAAGGDAVAYLSRGSVEARPEGNRSLELSSVLSRRGAGGEWGSEDISPQHHAVSGLQLGGGLEYKIFSLDLSLALMDQREAGTLLSPAASERTSYLRANTEPPAFTPLVTGVPGFANVPPGTEFGGGGSSVPGVQVKDATADLGHVVLNSAVPLSAGAAPLALYMWHAGALQPASVLPAGEGGAVVNGEVGSSRRSIRGALSADGSRLFWTSKAGDALYVRDFARGETARLDVEQEGAFGTGDAAPVFWGADTTGAVALFTDTRGLTADASETGADLYRCEVRVSGGELGCDVTNLTAENAESGESGETLGIPLGVSADAARVYFVARGALDARPGADGGNAAPGRPNLYLWRLGSGVRFIATLSEKDFPDWGTEGAGAGPGAGQSAFASPSGRYLAFMSELPLTGYDNAVAGSPEPCGQGHPEAICAEEVFRYDAVAEELVCVSCNPSGARPRALAGRALPGEFEAQEIWADQLLAAGLPELSDLGEGLSPYRPRAVHDDGRVFFNAFDSLVAADSNGLGDVYEYEPIGTGSCTAAAGGAALARAPGGCAALLSSGAAKGDGAAFLDASESGEDVFFYTAAPLSVTDKDADLDVYDARVAGVEASLPSNAECQGEACQPPTVASAPQTPASATFRGPGNVGEGRRAARSCTAPARRARRLSLRARKLRRHAKLMARHPARGRAAGRLRRGARRLAHRARKTHMRAKRCRARKTSADRRRSR